MVSFSRPLSRLLTLTALVLLPALASAETRETDDSATSYYVVSPGDTLGSIALRFNVGLSEVQAWNGLDTIQIEPGHRLVVKSSEKVVAVDKKPLPVVHVIRRGDTFEGVAKKYGVKIAQIKRWNRRLNPRRLQLGQEIRLWIPGRDGRSASYGAANRGRLYNGIPLEQTPGLKIRNVSRAYATKRVVRLLEAAAADLAARWPDAPPLAVGDLSHRRGGSMRPHKSHQSGRDADLSYYHRGNVETEDFVDMVPETFDAAKNWHMFKVLIDTEQVEYIFVEYALQKQLYDYAISIGYTPEELAPILQYPAGRRARTGIIRYARGHDDHWHIRFTCGPLDKHCH